MNQKQRILKSDAPIHTVAGRTYKGANPTVVRDICPMTGVDRGLKVIRGSGIPFVRCQVA